MATTPRLAFTNAKSFSRPASAPDTAWVRDRLIEVGLRPTWQRMALGALLLGAGDRHVTADKLFEEANQNRLHISLATIYNTLRQFTMVGLLREIAVPGARSWFDTTTGPHCHFLVEQEEMLFDIPSHEVGMVQLPNPPDGMEIVGADIIVRLRRNEILG